MKGFGERLAKLLEIEGYTQRELDNMIGVTEAALSRYLKVARDTWFSEIITISDNDDYDQVFSIEDVKEAWSNDGENTVDVKRTRMNL
ncbi:MAG: hypothetical protein IJ600_13195 [Lachnospiraceae bacterium]|nr:hypothetical protein [Lachnospiraceae bacterium]MBR1472582.1 hypothetical protein [Lachnospiraceae bacterium]